MQWTESVGLTLVGRDQSSMQLRTPTGQILNFTILQIFPFTYESKRMGIIVRVRATSAVLSNLQCLHKPLKKSFPGLDHDLTSAGLLLGRTFVFDTVINKKIDKNTLIVKRIL